MPLNVSGINMAGLAKLSSVCALSERSMRAVLTRPMTSSSPPRHTANQLCDVLILLSVVPPAFSKPCATVRSASSHTISLRGTMIEVSGRSSRWNRFCTICRSCASITPASRPSSRLADISASVMARALLVLMRSSLSTPWVHMVSSLTNGLATLASHVMGRAITRATASGYSSPMRLGTSSPKISVIKVIVATTMVVAVGAANLAVKPTFCKNCATPSLKAASPTIPLSMPIEVMPTCTVDSICVGFSFSSSAAWAPGSPPSAMAIRRVLRLAVSAISLMAKAPLIRVSSAIRIKSIVPK